MNCFQRWLWFGALFGFTESRKTIVISADGFRWDYYGRVATPGLDRIKAGGVHVKNLENAFATDTFPNHFTLATGLFEESHGIVDNEMYDPVFNETFNMSTTDPKWWQGGEPIWITAAKAGKKSVCVNWVGCAIPIEGEYPTFWAPYNGYISYYERVDTIMNKLFTEDAELGMLYFEEPDHSCHGYGPDSNEVLDAIVRVDHAVAYLLDNIDVDEVNVVFTSDHGGYGISKEMTIVLQAYTNLEFYMPDGGAIANIWPVNAQETDTLLTQFAGIHATQGRCYAKDQVPQRLHYRFNRRIAPIVCIAELGWSITKTTQDRERWHLKGSHGYDPTLDELSPMRPIFLARGPDIIAQGVDDAPLPPFQNVNIHPLIADLMGIPPEFMPMINGSVDNVSHILRRTTNAESTGVEILQW